jgi:hypothetical protein
VLGWFDDWLRLGRRFTTKLEVIFLDLSSVFQARLTSSWRNLSVSSFQSSHFINLLLDQNSVPFDLLLDHLVLSLYLSNLFILQLNCRFHLIQLLLSGLTFFSHFISKSAIVQHMDSFREVRVFFTGRSLYCTHLLDTHIRLTIHISEKALLVTV